MKADNDIVSIKCLAWTGKNMIIEELDDVIYL